MQSVMKSYIVQYPAGCRQ